MVLVKNSLGTNLKTILKYDGEVKTVVIKIQQKALIGSMRVHKSALAIKAC